jgi:hypothetical protein
MADVTLTFAAKDVGFAAAMQRMQSRLTGFNRSMSGVAKVSAKVRGNFGNLTRSVVGLAAAYVGVSQAINAFSKALSLGGQLDDLSKLTGATAGEMLLLQKAFQLGGSSADAVAPTISRLSRFLGEAQLGGKAQIETLQRLGLTYRDLARLSPTEQLRLLAQRLMAIQDPTLRTKAAMDIFGRSGATLIPLFKDFSGELDKASGYLGSMPEIMDRSATKMADLGDSVAAIGEKLTQFTAGFLDGASGVNEFADAIANFDAAAAGVQFGKVFAGIAKDPGSGFVLFGEILLLAVTKAGNALANSMIFAADVYRAALSDPKTFKGLMDGLLAGFQMIFNFAASMTQTIVKTFAQGLAGIASLIPAIGPALARSIAEPIASIEKLQEETAKQGEALRARMSASMGSTASDILERAKTMPRSDVDFLGAGKQADEVKALAARLNQLGAPQAQAPGKAGAAAAQQVPTKTVAELNQIYNEQLKKLRDANLSTDEFGKKLKELNVQMNQALRYYAAPPVQQTQDAMMGRPDRDEAVNSASGKSANAMEEVASETTLQKVASLMESLNTKLPQPVLV